MHFFEGERGPSPTEEAKASDRCGGHRTADPPLLGLAQSDAVWAHYPHNQAGRRKAVISMGALQWGHLNTGLGLDGFGISMTRKISCTSFKSLLALPCRKP